MLIQSSPWKNWDMFSFQELCTVHCDIGPVHYQAEVMAEDEWHNNGPLDLVTVSLCIQIAIGKMQWAGMVTCGLWLCSLW
jgi:hypothetical protein